MARKRNQKTYRWRYGLRVEDRAREKSTITPGGGERCFREYEEILVQRNGTENTRQER